MKKFLLLVCSLVAIGCVLYHSGFFKFLQSGGTFTEAARVEVSQTEYSRSPSGDSLQKFRSTAVLFPDEKAYQGSPFLEQLAAYRWPLKEDETIYLWQNGITRAVDKIVTAENHGNVPVYVRIVFAFEKLEGTVWKNVCTTGSKDGMVYHGSVNIHGSPFDLYSYTYDQPLQPEESTLPSLLQVVLDRDITESDMQIIRQGYEIMSATQACQANTLPNELSEHHDASTVLDTLLGEISPQQHPWIGQ